MFFEKTILMSQGASLIINLFVNYFLSTFHVPSILVSGKDIRSLHTILFRGNLHSNKGKDIKQISSKYVSQREMNDMKNIEL